MAFPPPTLRCLYWFRLIGPMFGPFRTGKLYDSGHDSHASPLWLPLLAAEEAARPGGERMTPWQQAITIALIVLGTVLTRFLAF